MEKYPFDDAYENRMITYSIKPTSKAKKNKSMKESQLSNDELKAIYSDNLLGERYDIK
jgi:hypothetical protein